MWSAGLDAWLRALADADEFSGVVVARRGEQQVFSGAYGWASRRWAVPSTLAMRFDTASITKLFTSVAVLRLADQGRLDLDQPITELVDLAGTTIAPQVTLRHLLTHTSGIADDADEEAGERYEELWVEKPVYSVTQTRDFLPQFAQKPANFAPGQGCRYCNVGYILAGLAIETITQTSYRDHIRHTLFAPAGMTHSDFYDRRDATPLVAEGWDPVIDTEGRITGWRQNIFSFPPIGSPDAGAHTTAEDLLRFLQTVRAGQLLSSEHTEQFFTPHVHHHDRNDGTAVWYGLGLEFTREPNGSVWHYAKDGVNTGASGIIRHYPTFNLDIAILSNTERGSPIVAREIDHRLRASRKDP